MRSARLPAALVAVLALAVPAAAHADALTAGSLLLIDKTETIGPVDDPSPTHANQLADRDEVALIEQMLTDFRDRTGKGAAMIGAHASVSGVPEAERCEVHAVDPVGLAADSSGEEVVAG